MIYFRLVNVLDLLKWKPLIEKKKLKTLTTGKGMMNRLLFSRTKKKKKFLNMRKLLEKQEETKRTSEIPSSPPSVSSLSIKEKKRNWKCPHNWVIWRTYFFAGQILYVLLSQDSQSFWKKKKKLYVYKKNSSLSLW